MSTLEEAIKSQMTADAGVSAITSAFHPNEIPQGFDVPCVVYQLISSPELNAAEYVEPRVQLTSWAKSYGEAVALANAVRACFYNRHLTVLGVHFRSKILNSMDGGKDLDTGRWSRIVDVRFVYRNPT